MKKLLHLSLLLAFLSLAAPLLSAAHYPANSSSQPFPFPFFRTKHLSQQLYPARLELTPEGRRALLENGESIVIRQGGTAFSTKPYDPDGPEIFFNCRGMSLAQAEQEVNQIFADFAATQDFQNLQQQANSSCKPQPVILGLYDCQFFKAFLIYPNISCGVWQNYLHGYVIDAFLLSE